MKQEKLRMFEKWGYISFSLLLIVISSLSIWQFVDVIRLSSSPLLSEEKQERDTLVHFRIDSLIHLSHIYCDEGNYPMALSCIDETERLDSIMDPILIDLRLKILDEIKRVEKYEACMNNAKKAFENKNYKDARLCIDTISTLGERYSKTEEVMTLLSEVEKYERFELFLSKANTALINKKYQIAKAYADSIATLGIDSANTKVITTLLVNIEKNEKYEAFLDNAKEALTKGNHKDAKSYLNKISSLGENYLKQDEVSSISVEIEKSEKYDEYLFNAKMNLANNKLQEAKSSLKKISSLGENYSKRKEVATLRLEIDKKRKELQYNEYLSMAQKFKKTRNLERAYEYLSEIKKLGAPYSVRKDYVTLMNEIEPPVKLKTAELSEDWPVVRQLALNGYLPACGSLAKHYLNLGSEDNEFYCRAYYWAKKSGEKDKQFVINSLKGKRLLNSDGSLKPELNCMGLLY